MKDKVGEAAGSRGAKPSKELQARRVALVRRLEALIKPAVQLGIDLKIIAKLPGQYALTIHGSPRIRARYLARAAKHKVAEARAAATVSP